MAMRRRFRGGFGRRGRRRGARPRWTADSFVLDIAAGAIGSQVILSETDFGTSTTLESECLLHRIILHGTVIASVAGLSTVGLGIGLCDEAVTPTFGVRFDPTLIDSLVDDDWLWTKSVPALTLATTLDPAIYAYVEADIRVKRKVKSTDTLRFVLSNLAGGVAITSDWQMRLLVTPRL